MRHAETAVELAAEPGAGGGSERHRVKSQVVLAAALCSAGDVDRARIVGDAALEAAGRLGLIPLQWALACLLGDIGSVGRPAGELVALRDSSADWVRRAGGTWARATG